MLRTLWKRLAAKLPFGRRTSTALESRKLLVQALRSGEYQQTRRRLHRPDIGYCCLGVACEVYQKHVGGLAIDGSSVLGKCYDGERDMLPPKVAQWLKFTPAGQFKRADGSVTSCITLNDEKLKSFAEIADEIENPANTFLTESQPL